MRVAPPGSGDPANLPHAGELFADRESESEAFKAALSAFRRTLDADGAAGHVRHNVLTFYGMGGIGKTALSERLEAWARRKLPLVNGWGPPPANPVAATARVDLHGSAGQVDLTAALISLRAGLAEVRPRWPVFDLAFAAYWSAVRPGEALPRYRGSDALAEAIAGSVSSAVGGLGSLALPGLGGTVAGTGADLGVHGVRRVVAALRRRHDLRLAVAAYEGYERFLLRCADEPSPTDPRLDLVVKLAGVLSWELAAIAPSPLVVAFVDTTERLKLDPRRVAERHLNELVYAMPNVLFVLTGRDLIDWWDERRTMDPSRTPLPHGGRHVWPGLVPGALEEPRQHLVGNLSASDTRSVVLRARQLFDLPIPDDVVDELVAASSGLPQYLELARQVAASVQAAGLDQVRVEDVTGSLGSLVSRVLDDVPDDERRAIQAAALFRIFDTRLMAAAAGVDHGTAERAVRRPMVENYGGDRFPYRMHDAVREAIRGAGPGLEGGWSERDWSLAATRAAAEARLLHDEARQRRDNRSMLDAIGVAATLACEQDVTLERGDGAWDDWLAQAIAFAPSMNGLLSRVPAESDTVYGRAVLDFLAGKDPRTDLDTSVSLLNRVFESTHPLRSSAGRHVGYQLRAAGRFDDAVAALERLVARDPSPINVQQVPITLRMARRFSDAQEYKARQGNPPAFVGPYDSWADAYAHGLPDRYFLEVPALIAMYEGRGRIREYLSERGTLLMRRAFLQPDPPEEGEVRDLYEAAEAAGHRNGVRLALATTVLLRRAGRQDRLEALDQIRGLERDARVRTSSHAIAEFCDAYLEGDKDRLAALRVEAERAPVRDRAWIPAECFLEAAGMPLTPVPTQWLEPYPVVLRRWTEHLYTYAQRHGRTA